LRGKVIGKVHGKLVPVRSRDCATQICGTFVSIVAQSTRATLTCAPPQHPAAAYLTLVVGMDTRPTNRRQPRKEIL